MFFCIYTRSCVNIEVREHSCFSSSMNCGAATMENGFKSPFWIQKFWEAEIWTEYSNDLVFCSLMFLVV